MRGEINTNKDFEQLISTHPYANIVIVNLHQHIHILRLKEDLEIACENIYNGNEVGWKETTTDNSIISIQSLSEVPIPHWK